MTEAEAYELFALIAEHQNQLMFGYFSVVSAFLIMSYFVAEKLDRFLAVIVVGLYSLCCLWFMAGLQAWKTDLVHIYAEMLQKKSDGTFELEWFGHNPDWLASAMNNLQISVSIGGWVISTAYFIYKRQIAKSRGDV